ncbi:MAG: glycosyltransferase family 2 protein [Candidatus Omnitrophota bacterium]
MNQIEISIIFPCLNEAETVKECIDKSFAVLKNLGVSGEVIVIDNGSTDNSYEIAKSTDARVVKELRRGYGSAYLRGFQEARGKYLVMADMDNSYDISQIPEFVKELKDGYDFVIGSRFKGKILSGAMPWTNRYIGNPILSFILRLFFHTQISDAHCGMRAITKEAYQRLSLHTTGMEFASEMIVSALREKLNIKEIPITYWPRKGKSKLNPIKDAWRHMRFMLLYSPTYLFLIPGLILAFLGVIVLIVLLPGPFYIAGHGFDMHMMTVGALAAILGLQVLSLGLYAKTYSFFEGFVKNDKTLFFILRFFNLEKGILLGIVIFSIGLIANIRIIIKWIAVNFGALDKERLALFGITFMIIGVQVIFSSFFLSLLTIRKK